MRFSVLIGALLFATAASADPKFDLAQFVEYENAGTTALRAGDYAQAEDNYATAINYGAQQPKAYFNLAAAQAKRGEKEKALQTLARFAEFGISANIDASPDFADIRGTEEFARIRARIAQLTAPLCPCKTVYEGSSEPFIAEGLSHDLRTSRLFVAGVHARKIVAIQNGVAHDFAEVPDGMSVFGIHINAAHDLIWAAAAPIAQGGATSYEQGASALMAFDITSGALRARYDAPPSGNKRVIGDLAIAIDGTVYVSDAVEGSIFRLKPGSTALEPVGDPSRFPSPQGMVPNTDDTTLLVADYTTGLWLMDVSSGLLTPVAVPPGVTMLGLDGLVRLPDGSFAATQNGVSPARVVRFTLGKGWTKMTSFSVLARASAQIADPALLAVDGNDVLVSGVSQWSSFDDDKSDPSRPVQPWKIVRVTLH